MAVLAGDSEAVVLAVDDSVAEEAVPVVDIAGGRVVGCPPAGLIDTEGDDGDQAEADPE